MVYNFFLTPAQKTTFINKKEDLTYFQYRENVIEYLKVSYHPVTSRQTLSNFIKKEKE